MFLSPIKSRPSSQLPHHFLSLFVDFSSLTFAGFTVSIHSILLDFPSTIHDAIYMLNTFPTWLSPAKVKDGMILHAHATRTANLEARNIYVQPIPSSASDLLHDPLQTAASADRRTSAPSRSSSDPQSSSYAISDSVSPLNRARA